MDAPTVEIQYLDSVEAATYTGYSVHTIRDAVARGRLECYRRGARAHMRFTRSQLDAWMETMRARVSPPRSRRSA